MWRVLPSALSSRSIICFLMSMFFVWEVVAAPGSVSQSPLMTSGSAPPNVYFSLDTSGSMWNILPDSPYDPNVIYFTCPPEITLSNTSTISIYIARSGGIPYFKVSPSIGNPRRSWGTSVGTGNFGYQKRCFDPNLLYNARLAGNDPQTDNGRSTYRGTSAMGSSIYTGNYLNWYFGSTPTTFGNNARRKPNQLSRYQVMKTVANDLLDDMENLDIQVGIGGFDRTTRQSGANILVGIDNISTNLTALKSAISGLSIGGATPLGTTLSDIGRYFVQGYNQMLTLHPGESNEETKSAYTIFSTTPVYATGVEQISPIEAFCQRSFVILLTDGLSTNDNAIQTSSGLTDYDNDCVGNPDCSNYDRKSNSLYGSSTGSDYLDDVAKALFEIDLRPDLNNNGDAVTNNISTYVIGFADSTVQNSPMLEDTATHGGGQFLAAKNASELKEVFKQITTDIVSRAASASGLSFSGPTISNGTSVFLTSYTSNLWIGDLVKSNVNSDGSLGSTAWSAAALLNAANPATRFVFTYNEDINAPVSFKLLDDLSVAQQADLMMNPDGTTDMATAQERIDYLRGVTTNTNFRSRFSIFPDLVHATPIYVGAPDSNWRDTAPFPTTDKYSTFKANHVNRTPYVYLGVNGGMLFGINADTGQVNLSYIPNTLFSTVTTAGLHYLTWPSYLHRYYVDLPPQVQDVYISGSWRTVLVGGLGGGGKGYYALDVTNPSQFSESGMNNVFMWEFTHPDLGLTYSKPAIGLMNDGRWAAIFGNGYNNTGTGSAKLFIVYLDGGLDGTWTLGTDYLVFDTKVGNASNLNGLSSVSAVDINGDGTIDRIYAGDVLGNMWAVDVSGGSNGNWDFAYGGTDPDPLFSAGADNPITAAPTVVRNTKVSSTATNSPNTLVLFGTGQYITTSDPRNLDAQRFYAVWDSGVPNLEESNLLEQTFTQSGTNRIMGSQSVTYDSVSGQMGWYIPFTGSERVITKAIIRDDIVFFSTLIPDVSSICAIGGVGYIMAVDFTNGGQPLSVVFDVNNDGEIDQQDNIGDFIVGGIFIGDGIPLQPALRLGNLYLPTSTGILKSLPVIFDDTIGTDMGGRVSWQELKNRQ